MKDENLFAVFEREGGKGGGGSSSHHESDLECMYRHGMVFALSEDKTEILNAVRALVTVVYLHFFVLLFFSMGRHDHVCISLFYCASSIHHRYAGSHYRYVCLDTPPFLTSIGHS